MLNEKQNYMWDVLTELEGETVAKIFTNYYGNQLLSDEFYDFLVEEGYIYNEEETEED